MGMNSFAPWSQNPECFIVQNITSNPGKVIRIFNYPINQGSTRDLLRIPGVAEGDIRSSLLKGELNHKLRAGEIMVLCSDIDLLQFNNIQKAFLESAGVVNGLSVSGGQLPFAFRQNIRLVGLIDGINQVFTVPSPDKFINGDFSDNTFKIQVYHNNIGLQEGQDYFVSESGGLGTGFDTITLTSFTPNPNTFLYANYVVKV